MKRGIFFLCLSLLFLSFVSSVPVLEFQHEDTHAGETILGTIQAQEFAKEIAFSDLKFYQGRKQISLESNIIYHNGKHYLYVYTTKPLNATLQIENILYKENGILKSTTITKDLNITESQNQTLSIKPGLVFTTQAPKIKLINSGSNSINLTYDKTELSLQPQASEEITITPTSSFFYFNISTYKEFSVPIIYLGQFPDENETIIINETNETTKNETTFPNFQITPNKIEVEAHEKNFTIQNLTISNFGKDLITGLKISYNLTFLEIEEIEELQPNETVIIEITLSPEIPGNFEDNLTISYIYNEVKYQEQISVNLFVLPVGTTKENFTRSVEEYCSDLGQVCEQGTICNGTATFTDNFTKYCCLASCVSTTPEEESSGFGWIMGLVLLIILAVLGYGLYQKQKKYTPQTSKDKMVEISKKLESRISPSSRISGGLEK